MNGLTLKLSDQYIGTAYGTDIPTNKNSSVVLTLAIWITYSLACFISGCQAALTALLLILVACNLFATNCNNNSTTQTVHR